MGIKSWIGAATLVLVGSMGGYPAHALAEPPAAAPLAQSRTERHREMAETGIREHQAMTAAHVAGRKPVIARSSSTGVSAQFFTPQIGEQTHPEGINWGGAEKYLKELQIFWKRIPNFGITAEVFPNERGWAQVVHYSGTADDGSLQEAQEIDIFYTDEKFNVVRMEIYSDLKQWKDLLTFLGYGEMTGTRYHELLESQPGSK